MSKSEDSKPTEEVKQTEGQKPKQVGNITILEELKNPYNLVDDLYYPKGPKKKPLDRDEVLYFDLGVEKGKEDIAYASKSDFKLADYKEVKKYYKDAEGKIHDYNNGEELKEYGRKITAMAQHISNNYGSNNYSKAFQKEIEAIVLNLDKGLKYKIGSEALDAGFDKGKDILLDQINEGRLTADEKRIYDGIYGIRSEFIALRNDSQFKKLDNQELNNKLKKLSDPIGWQQEQAVKYADAIRELAQNPKMSEAVKNDISEFLKKLDENNKAIANGEKKESNFAFLADNLLKDSKFQERENLEHKEKLQNLVDNFKSANPGNFTKEAKDFIQDCKTQGLLDANNPLATSLKTIDYKMQLNTYPLINSTFQGFPYHTVLEEAKKALQGYHELEAKLKAQPTLAYARDFGIEGTANKPQHQDFVKAITKMITEQKQITGLDPNDPNFKEQLNTVPPDKKLEISFNKNNASRIYKISSHDFIKIMQKIDLKSIQKMKDHDNPRSFVNEVKEELEKAGFSEKVLKSSFVRRNEDKIEKEIDKVEKQIEKAERKVEKAEKKIEKAEKKIEKAEKEGEKVEKKVEKAEKKIEKAEKKIEKAKLKTLGGLASEKIAEKTPVAIPASNILFPEKVREQAEQKAAIDLENIKTRSKPLPPTPQKTTAGPIIQKNSPKTLPPIPPKKGAEAEQIVSTVPDPATIKAEQNPAQVTPKERKPLGPQQLRPHIKTPKQPEKQIISTVPDPATIKAEQNPAQVTPKERKPLGPQQRKPNLIPPKQPEKQIVSTVPDPATITGNTKPQPDKVLMGPYRGEPEPQNKGNPEPQINEKNEPINTAITRKEIIGVHRRNKPIPEVTADQAKQIITTTPPQPQQLTQNTATAQARSNIEPPPQVHEQQIKNLKQKLGQKLQNTLSKIGQALKNGSMRQSSSQENNSAIPKNPTNGKDIKSR